MIRYQSVALGLGGFARDNGAANPQRSKAVSDLLCMPDRNGEKQPALAAGSLLHGAPAYLFGGVAFHAHRFELTKVKLAGNLSYLAGINDRVALVWRHQRA